MNRLPLQLIWHYLLVGMSGAFVIALWAFKILNITGYWDVLFVFVASLIGGLMLGACSHAAYQFMTQASNSEKPLILINGMIFIIISLCISGGMMLMLYIPLYLECLLLMQFEKRFPEAFAEKPKRSL